MLIDVAGKTGLDCDSTVESIRLHGQMAADMLASQKLGPSDQAAESKLRPSRQTDFLDPLKTGPGAQHPSRSAE